MGNNNSSNNNSTSSNNNNSNGGHGTHFLYLQESGVTINLAQIAAVLWNSVTEGEAGSNYTSTVCTSAGDFSITGRDAQILERALTSFNRQKLHSHQALLALPALYQLSDALFWLSKTGYSEQQEVAAASHQAKQEQAQHRQNQNRNPLKATVELNSSEARASRPVG